MMGMPLAYWVHDLNPVLLPLYGNLAIRWYGLSYALGFVVAAVLLHLYYKRKRSPWNPDEQVNAIIALALGTMAGGRLGYMVFYDLHGFLKNPLSLFYVWEGGMASHGGFIGCALAIFYIARKTATPFLKAGDILVTLAPPGLFFGRIANFINGELWGKITDLPWAVIFPRSASPGTPLSEIPPRHPSQLYEAALEGIVLGLYIQFRFWLSKPKERGDGQLTGEFFCLYAILRIIGEVYREPDPAGLILGLSRGTFYSLFLLLFGGLFLCLARRKKMPSG